MMKKRIEQVLSAILQLPPEDRAELKRQLQQFSWWTEEARAPAGRSAKAGWQPDFTVIFDGGSQGNPGPGYGSFLIIRNYDGEARRRELRFGDSMTNNEAEYDALVAALTDLVQWIRASEGDPAHTTVEIRGDSQLVISQVSGAWRAKDARMLARRDRVLQLLRAFGGHRLVQHPREESVRYLGH